MKKILLQLFPALVLSVSLNAQYVSFYLDNNYGCEPLTVNAFNYSDTFNLIGPAVFHWTINGKLVHTGPDLPPQNLPAGEYEITLRLFDGAGMIEMDYQSAYLEVYSYPKSFNISSGPTACPGEKINFWIDDAVYWWSMDWDFGDGSFKTYKNYENHPDHTFYNAGIYQVTLILQQQCGTDTLVQMVNVNSSAIPQPTAFVDRGGVVCPNDEVFFNVMGNFKSYSWDFGDGTSSKIKNPSHFFDTQVAKDIDVTLTVTNQCGKQGNTTATVSFVQDLPANAYFWTDPSYGVCPNTAVKFSSESSGTYEWDFGDGSYSRLPNPVNYYAAPGTYYVTLRLTNGCGSVDTYTEMVEVQYNFEDVPYVNYSFEVEYMDWELLQGDTLRICPNEQIKFKNYSYSMMESEMKYNWDFGDGQTSKVKEPVHVYSGTGIKQVTLTATSNCGGTNSFTRYVHIDPEILPQTELGVVPELICTGEMVYFFDNNGADRKQFIYDIDFGDGTVINNIVSNTDTLLQTLANHTYSGINGSRFNYVLTARNKCGNELKQNGTIEITNDATAKPFYYVSNTTTTDDEATMENWGVRHDNTDHEFIINVTWPDWPGGQNKFSVYFWYDGFYPGNNYMGGAAGYVEFTSNTISSNATVHAYIPIDPLQSPTIGFAAGWSCNGIYTQGIEPEVWGMQMNFQGMPQNIFDLAPGGSDNMGSIGDPIVLNMDGSWDGFCNNEKPKGNYYYQLSPDAWMQLNFDEEYGEYYLDVTSDKQGYNYLASISWGSYYIPGPGSVELIEAGNCMQMGYYQITVFGTDSIRLFNGDDGCPEQYRYLDSKTFRRHPDFGANLDLSACIGDKVQFQCAGGSSWKWNFGDGSAISTVQHPVHIYNKVGKFDAFVIATNSCGRTDTIHTPVKIGLDNKPLPYFWYDGWDLPRLEPVEFHSELQDYMDRAGNYSYLWDFGDGSTSTEKNPWHTYQRDGEYTVNLTITNGCGSSTGTQGIWIRDAEMKCEAKFDYSSDGLGVGFSDLSRGDVTSWFWDFGDGTTSSKTNPVHTYSRAGIYTVCLSIYDETNDCATQTCRRLELGTFNCQADFGMTVNNGTKTVAFSGRSVGADVRFWDFGDGSFSDIKNPVHTYNEPGMYITCLGIYNLQSDCYSEICKEVRVGTTEDNLFCFADFSFFVDESKQEVRFTDKSSSNITNWYWTFGDGSYKESRNPSHIYPVKGAFETCLIVFDQNSGCADEICKTVPVGVTGCNVASEFTFFVDMANNSVTFNDRSIGSITNWFWDFGDGTTSSRQNPKHEYARKGFYLVTLSVWDKNNDCSDYSAEFLQIGEPDCRAGFEYKVDMATNIVQFYDQSRGNIAEYFWDFGDGTFSTEKDPGHFYREPGMYFVAQTVLDNAGLCMDFVFETVQVGQVSCAAKFKYFIDSANNMGYFSPDAIGDITDYLWFFGDGSISTNPNVKHAFRSPGYFTVGLNTYDNATGCMDYYEEVILIGREGENCRARFAYMTNAEKKEVKFTDNSRGNIVEYFWEFGDGNFSTDQNPVHVYDDGGYYMVCMTVLNSFGIPDFNCKYIQVAPDEARDCFADFIYTVDSASRSVSFAQKSYGEPDGFSWNFGDGFTSTEKKPVHVFAESDYYLVRLNIRNSTTGCVSEHMELVNVAEGNQGIKAGFRYTVDKTGKKADSYPVDYVGVTLGDAGKLKWDYGDGEADSTSLSTTHVYDSAGQYYVCLTITNEVTGDEDTSCDTVTTEGYTSVDPEAAWNTMLANYPNPFDHTTYIVYKLPEATQVDLTLYDNAGRMIRKIVNKEHIAGDYRLEFNREDLDSGIYHLRMVTNRRVITKKMIIR